MVFISIPWVNIPIFFKCLRSFVTLFLHNRVLPELHVLHKAIQENPLIHIIITLLTCLIFRFDSNFNLNPIASKVHINYMVCFGTFLFYVHYLAPFIFYFPFLTIPNIYHFPLPLFLPSGFITIVPIKDLSVICSRGK